jgi:hypothetical protein
MRGLDPRIQARRAVDRSDVSILGSNPLPFLIQTGTKHLTRSTRDRILSAISQRGLWVQPLFNTQSSPEQTANF